MLSRIFLFSCLIFLANVRTFAEAPRRYSHINESREEVIHQYRSIYLTANQYPNSWTETGKCEPGKLSSGHLRARLQEINYFRDLVGLEPVSFSEKKNELAQAAAHLMLMNGTLSHSPPRTWKCWSEKGSSGAGASNLGYGGNIYSYIRDAGSNNRPCGHRMWMLKGKSIEFGFGETRNTSAIYVFGPTEEKDSLPEFVSYPAAGYMPSELCDSRWTFSVPGIYAGYQNATVKVMVNGREIPLVYSEATTYGDGGLAFELDDYYEWEEKMLERKVTVEVKNVEVGNETRAYKYSLILVKATPGVYTEVRPEEILFTGLDRYQPVVTLSQLSDLEEMHLITQSAIEQNSGTKLSMDKDLVDLARKLARIRKENNLASGHLNNYAGGQIAGILNQRELASKVPKLVAEKDFLVVEIKKAVPLDGRATIGKVGEVLAAEFLESGLLSTFLRQSPNMRNTGIGLSLRRFSRKGNLYAGVYATLLVAPGASATGAEGG